MTTTSVVLETERATAAVPALQAPPAAVAHPTAVTGRTVMPLRVGFAWSFVGWVVYAACQWVMLSLMTKLGNPTVVGEFALGLAVSAPVFMFTNLQLRGVQSTDARGEYAFSDYIALRLAGSAIALLALGSVCPFLGLTRGAVLPVLLVAAFKALESLGDVVAGLMQKLEMLDCAAIALILRGVLGIGAFGICYALTRRLGLSLLLWTVCVAMVVWLYDFRKARRLAAFEGGIMPRFEWSRLKPLMLTSLPLGFVGALNSFNTNIPRYAIQHSLSTADLGIFASVAYPVTAATIVAISLGQSALARQARLFAEDRRKEFTALLAKLVACGAAIGVFLMTLVATCGPRFLTILYTPEYARHTDLFLLMAAVAGLNTINTFLSYSLTAAQQFRVQLPISLGCMLTTFLAASYLVPRFRLMGAGVALLCSSCVLVVACSAVLFRTLRTPAHQGGQ